MFEAPRETEGVREVGHYTVSPCKKMPFFSTNEHTNKII